LIAAIILLAAMGSQATPGPVDRRAALDSLIAAEREFSRASEEKGIREAFLTWLAPDAIVFRPGPTEGLPIYEKMDAADPAVLTWEPEFAEIAGSGEMGYTTGPYQLRPDRGSPPTVFGHYVTVWKKQPDGGWKVFLDIGVQHERPSPPGSVVEVFMRQPGGDVGKLSPEALKEEGRAVGGAMMKFIQEIGIGGYRRALAGFAASDIRIFRTGRLPFPGGSTIRELVPRSDGRDASPGRRTGSDVQSRSRFQVRLALSGDLAIVYGTSDRPHVGSGPAKSAFLEIWRKDASDVWRICLDIQLPVPAEKADTRRTYPERTLGSGGSEARRSGPEESF